MAIYQRRNRITKGIVKLHRERRMHTLSWIDWYYASCEHESTTEKLTQKSHIISQMSHPWLWCSQCEDVRCDNVDKHSLERR